MTVKTGCSISTVEQDLNESLQSIYNLVGKTCTDQLCTMRTATWINKVNNASLFILILNVLPSYSFPDSHTFLIINDSPWTCYLTRTWQEFQHKHSDSLYISLRCVCECFHLLWGIKCVDRSPKAFWICSRQDTTHSSWGETQLRCLRVYVCLYSVNCIHPYTCLKWKPRGKVILFFSLLYTDNENEKYANSCFY